MVDEFSIADIANWAWVRSHNWSGVDIEDLPNLQRWIDRIYERPACQRGLEVPPRDKDSDKLVASARKMLQK